MAVVMYFANDYVTVQLQIINIRSCRKALFVLNTINLLLKQIIWP